MKKWYSYAIGTAGFVALYALLDALITKTVDIKKCLVAAMGYLTANMLIDIIGSKGRKKSD